MTRLVLMLAALVSLCACGPEQKYKSICEEIVRSASIDPQGLKTNSNTVTKSALGFEELTEHFDGIYPKGIPPATQKLLAMYREDGEKLERQYVAIDYTASGRFGLSRDVAVCVFYRYAEHRVLHSVEIGGNTISGEKLFNFFFLHGRPKGLGTGDEIK